MHVGEIMEKRFILDEKYYSFGYKPKLLLHVCCAPCSSSVMECLCDYFDLTVLFYNPNIYPYEEYIKRKNEVIGYLNKMSINFIDCDYESEIYEKTVCGYENEIEGGLRCNKCIRLRLEKTFEYAKDFDYVCSTLSVSPHKNSKMINEIGLLLEKKYSVNYLVNDFKKNDGYKRSIELSKINNFYRQNYCGCKYSIREE